MARLTRRGVLRFVGGGAIVAAATAGGIAYAVRPARSAREPWRTAGKGDDPRVRALSYAVLAPNPHNLQPWLVELTGDDGVFLHRDGTRGLPQTDPFDRQITIGFGCFLEQLVIAASADGYAVDVSLYPGGEAGPVAHARFRAGSVPRDALFANLLERRSCKEPYEDRPIRPAAVDALSRHGPVIVDPVEVAALRDLTWEAWEIEAATPATHQESVDLMRFGRSAIEANPDGIDLGGGMLEALVMAGVLGRDEMLDPTSSASQQGREMYRQMLAATPAYAVVTSAQNARADQIAAGRTWLRLNLDATRLGLALHPVSQALQEFPEMADCRRRAHEMLAPDGRTVQMLGRLGYGPRTPPAPRWPLEAKMVNGS